MSFCCSSSIFSPRLTRSLLLSSLRLRKPTIPPISSPSPPLSTTRSTHSVHRNTQNSNVSHQLFDEMPERDVVTWTATISWFAKGTQKERALESFKSMLRHGVRPNYVTIMCVVNAARTVGSEELRCGLHGCAIKFGFGSEASVVTALLGAYSSVREVDLARELFREAPVKDLILWSAMVSACSKNEMYVEAIDTFREMQGCGLLPNEVSIVSVLPACGNSGALLLGKQTHGFAIKRGFYLETSLQNSLVDFYAKSNQLHVSIDIFDKMQQKDLISWNTIICGCTEGGRPSKALFFFLKMRFFEVMPGATILQSVLNASSHMGDLRLGRSLHCYIVKRNLWGSISIGTALLKMYAVLGEVDASHNVFCQLHDKDFIAWSAMISVYARGNHPFLALEAFREMQQEGIAANEVTLVSLLQACTSMGVEEHGRSIHARVIRVSILGNVFITSGLIDFYCKLGRLWQGEALFDMLHQKDTVCWSSMIKGYGINGFGEAAIETFNNMLEKGMKPNEVFFVSVLSACSHCGLIDEGWKWFNSMEGYGLYPTMAHYSCMVDMLSRQGQVEEAVKFISRMPMEPDARIWGAVLAGCGVTNGNVESLEIAARQLLKLDSKNSSYYVALSNMYANLGKWCDVERIRQLVDEKNLGKTAGYSTI